MRYEGAELTIYYEGGDISVSLTPIQLAVALKALGMHFEEHGDIYCTQHAESTLEAILKGNLNPFTLGEVKDEENYRTYD